MTTSVHSTNTNLIIKSLIYKQLNQPYYRIYKCIGMIMSKAVLLIFDVQGKGKIYETFVYDNKNNIIKYRHFYRSEKERKEEMKQNRKKKLGKVRYIEEK